MLCDISPRLRRAVPVSHLLWMSWIKLPTCRPSPLTKRSSAVACVRILFTLYLGFLVIEHVPTSRSRALEEALFRGIAPRLRVQSIHLLLLYLFRNMTSDTKSHLQVEGLEEALLSSVALRLRARHGQGRRARRVTDHVAARLRLHHALLDQVLELQRIIEERSSRSVF